MKIQNKHIIQFIENLPSKCKEPLDKIITNMLKESKYIDTSTIIYDENNDCYFDKQHYHNWECNPERIKAIEPFDKEFNENNDIELTTILGEYSPNIECIKGDVQLGKRLHACILMWMSIYIYERPVLYLFRPLNIDKEQLQDDIDGEEPWNFNMEWIKNKFNDFNEKNSNNKNYFGYRLPSLTDIKDKKVANKLSAKEYLSNPKMIYMALMNPTDLETLNRKFYEYILEYCEKVNITLIIDESDLLSPTAENSNNISEKDTKNSKSERLLSRLVNKVAHTIHITGTAHSFFWNYTTALSENEKTIIPVVKVFVMNRHNDYYGFMKKNINFSANNEDLPIISEWWSKGIKVQKEDKYDIINDYNKNIKKIITNITNRKNRYNSFLISEEKIQNNQIKIAEKIIKDFHSLFCVVFHGKKGKNGLPTGLRLYFPKKIDNLDIEKELQQVVISEKRLDKPGGLRGIPTSDNNKDCYDEYKYYDINMKSKEFNIKMVYKILARLFKVIKSNKTVITITGKYGERGYSFTSDYYDKDNKYVLHLTDQYFVSHASYNCTDIFQRGRIQGKYTDKPNLIFWTTNELVKIINEYVDYMTKIETKIMSLPRGHEYIRNLCEIQLVHPEFLKSLGTPKQRKNIDRIRIKYDRKNNALVYSFPPNLNPKNYEEHFSNWCKDQCIKFDGFINRLNVMEKKIYIEKKGEEELIIPKRIDKKIIDLNEPLNNKALIHNETSHLFDKIKIYKPTNNNMNRYDGIEQHIDNKIPYNHGREGPNECTIIYYQDKKFVHIVGKKNKKILPKSDLNIIQKENYKALNDTKILYSELNYKYINDSFLDHEFEGEEEEFDLSKEDIKTIIDKSYFFLTADGYVYHHDPEKSIKKVRIQIKSEIEETRNSELMNPILSFKEECINEIEGGKRVGIKKVMEVFNTWCKNNDINEYTKLKGFREDFEKITGLKRSKTNITGYKIELKI